MNNGEFCAMPPIPNSYRAYRLENGTVFTYNNVIFEFEDSLLYRVVEDGKDEFFNTRWVRTGEVFTAEEINKLKLM